MKKIFIICMYLSFNSTIVLVKAQNISVGDTIPDAIPANENNSPDFSQILGGLINYNTLGGNRGLANLVPEIQYGFSLISPLKDQKGIAHQLEIRPFVSGQIPFTDSSTYLPGLMLPGRAGIIINNFFVFPFNKDITKSNIESGNYTGFIINPASFGLKILPSFGDSTTTLLQHNIRLGAAFNVNKLFMVSAQYTISSHDLTSQSKNDFSKVFSTSKTNFNYLNVTLQACLNPSSDKPAFLILTWRKANTKNEVLKGLPNVSILTIGFVKNISINNAFPAIRSNN